MQRLPVRTAGTFQIDRRRQAGQGPRARGGRGASVVRRARVGLDVSAGSRVDSASPPWGRCVRSATRRRPRPWRRRRGSRPWTGGPGMRTDRAPRRRRPRAPPPEPPDDDEGCGGPRARQRSPRCGRASSWGLLADVRNRGRGRRRSSSSCRSDGPACVPAWRGAHLGSNRIGRARKMRMSARVTSRGARKTPSAQPIRSPSADGVTQVDDPPRRAFFLRICGERDGSRSSTTTSLAYQRVRRTCIIILYNNSKARNGFLEFSVASTPSRAVEHRPIR